MMVQVIFAAVVARVPLWPVVAGSFLIGILGLIWIATRHGSSFAKA